MRLLAGLRVGRFRPLVVHFLAEEDMVCVLTSVFLYKINDSQSLIHIVVIVLFDKGL